MTRAALILVFVLSACGGDDEVVPDANPTDAMASAIDARSYDASVADASSLPDADPASCNPDTIWHVIDNRAVRVGDFCDDIQLCAKDTATTAQITTAAPGFQCDAQPGQKGCSSTEYHCAWYNPDTLDATEYDQLCAITVLGDAPARLSCYVYL